MPPSCPCSAHNAVLQHFVPARIFFRVRLASPRSTLFPYTTLFRSHPGNGCLRWDAGGDSLRHLPHAGLLDRKSTRLNSSHVAISYAAFCLKKRTASSCVRSTPTATVRQFVASRSLSPVRLASWKSS